MLGFWSPTILLSIGIGSAECTFSRASTPDWSYDLRRIVANCQIAYALNHH
jgi:hypothetical protein